MKSSASFEVGCLFCVEWLRLCRILLGASGLVYSQTPRPGRTAIDGGSQSCRTICSQFLYLLLCLLSVSVSASLPVRLSCFSSVCLFVSASVTVLCSGKNFVHWLQTCFNCFVNECVAREERREEGYKLEGAPHSHAIQMRIQFMACQSQGKACAQMAKSSDWSDQERPIHLHVSVSSSSSASSSVSVSVA